MKTQYSYAHINNIKKNVAVTNREGNYFSITNFRDENFFFYYADEDFLLVNSAYIFHYILESVNNYNLFNYAAVLAYTNEAIDAAEELGTVECICGDFDEKLVSANVMYDIIRKARKENWTNEHDSAGDIFGFESINIRTLCNYIVEVEDKSAIPKIWQGLAMVIK